MLCARMCARVCMCVCVRARFAVACRRSGCFALSLCRCFAARCQLPTEAVAVAATAAAAARAVVCYAIFACQRDGNSVCARAVSLRHAAAYAAIPIAGAMRVACSLLSRTLQLRSRLAVLLGTGSRHTDTVHTVRVPVRVPARVRVCVSVC